MSKLARWIILSVTAFIIITIGLFIANAWLNNTTKVLGLIIVIIAGVAEVIGTYFIWTKKNIPDLTTSSPSK